MRHAAANFYPSESKHKEIKSVSTVQTQVVSEGREALSRATRQAIQALIPTLLVIAGGSAAGIDLTAVAWLAGVTALVSALKSFVGFKVGPTAPKWAQISERALTAAAGTALGYVTVDGIVPATVIHWETVLTASVGAAVTALAMYFTNPPVTALPAVVMGDPLDDVVDAPRPVGPTSLGPDDETTTFDPDATSVDADPFPTQRRP